MQTSQQSKKKPSLLLSNFHYTNGMILLALSEVNPFLPRPTYRFCSNARGFFSSKGDPLGSKGLRMVYGNKIALSTKDNIVTK